MKRSTARHRKPAPILSFLLLFGACSGSPAPAAAFSNPCGVAIPIEIDWNTVAEETRGNVQLAASCAVAQDTLATLCKVSSRIRETVPAKVKRIRCTFGGTEPGARLVSGGTVIWFPQGENLQQLAWDGLAVNLDFGRIIVKGKDDLYLLLNAGIDRTDIYAGDGKAFYKVAQVPPYATWSERHLAGAGDPVVSYQDNVWSIRCGERTVTTQELSRKERVKVLATAAFDEQPAKEAPGICERL